MKKLFKNKLGVTMGDNLLGDGRQSSRWWATIFLVMGDNLLCDGRQTARWRCTSLCVFLFSVIWLLASASKSSNIPWISSSSSPMLIHPISNLPANNEHTIIEKIWVVSSGTLYFRGIPRPPASLGRGSPQH